MDLTKMTRAQAERVVASTRDEPTLLLLTTHKNKHVCEKAKYKLAKIEKAQETVGVES